MIRDQKLDVSLIVSQEGWEVDLVSILRVYPMD